MAQVESNGIVDLWSGHVGDGSLVLAVLGNVALLRLGG